jgi:hypothetical protein
MEDSTFLPPVNAYQITWRSISGHSNIHSQFCENVRSIERSAGWSSHVHYSLSPSVHMIH